MGQFNFFEEPKPSRRKKSFKLPPKIGKTFHNVYMTDQDEYEKFWTSAVLGSVRQYFPPPNFYFEDDKSDNIYFNCLKEVLLENQNLADSVFGSEPQSDADDVENIVALSKNAEVPLQLETKQGETLLQCSDLGLETTVNQQEDGYNTWQQHHIVPLYELRKAAYRLDIPEIFTKLSVSPQNLVTVRRTQHIRLHKARFEQYNGSEDCLAYNLLSGMTDEAIKIIARMGAIAQNAQAKIKKQGFYSSEKQRELSRRAWAKHDMYAIVTTNGIKGNRLGKQQGPINYSQKEGSKEQRQITGSQSGKKQAKNRLITAVDVIIVYYKGEPLKTYTTIETPRQLIEKIVEDFPFLYQKIPSNIKKLKGDLSGVSKKLATALENKDLSCMSRQQQEIYIRQSTRSNLAFACPPLSQQKQEQSDSLRDARKPKKFEEYTLNQNQGVRVYYKDEILCEIWECKDHNDIKEKLIQYIYDTNPKIPLPITTFVRAFRDAYERFYNKKKIFLYEEGLVRVKSNNFSLDIIDRS